MTDAELLELLDRALTAWNQIGKYDQNDRLTIKTTWKRYIGEFTKKEAEKAIDNLMAEGEPYFPKIFDIRRQILYLRDGTPPPPHQAWGDFLRWGQDSASGILSDPPHPLIGETVRRLGPAAKGLSSGADRAFFIEAYLYTLREHYK